MSLNYRDNLGKAIDYDQWRIELAKEENAPKKTSIQYNSYEVDINLVYVGSAGSLYKVTVDVSEDVTKYHGYNEAYQGKLSAQNDYDRLLEAITQDQDIFDRTEFSPLGDVALFYDARYNTHVVNLLTSPEAWTYSNRADAESKFNEIIEA